LINGYSYKHGVGNSDERKKFNQELSKKRAAVSQEFKNQMNISRLN
jgi:hypothetical protein